MVEKFPSPSPRQALLKQMFFIQFKIHITTLQHIYNKTENTNQILQLRGYKISKVGEIGAAFGEWICQQSVQLILTWFIQHSPSSWCIDVYHA